MAKPGRPLHYTRADWIQSRTLEVNLLKPLVDAISTPLSSIFGSGFLIIVPILAGAVGSYAVLAMAAVCALAYAVGSVIRGVGA